MLPQLSTTINVVKINELEFRHSIAIVKLAIGEEDQYHEQQVQQNGVENNNNNKTKIHRLDYVRRYSFLSITTTPTNDNTLFSFFFGL